MTVNANILYRQTSETTSSDFKNFNKGKKNRVGGETIQQVNGGLQIHKPANSERAEVRGLKKLPTFQKGKKYYLSWDFMLSSTVTNNAIFQWKAYGSPITQNFPIVIKLVNGVLNVIQFQDPNSGKRRENFLFRKKIEANQWYSHMLAIYVSDENEGGTVEYWFDGYQQDLITHGKESKKVWPCRTFDGNLVDPKFGIYGAYGVDIDSSFRNLVIGETLEDMNYDKGPSSAAAGKSGPATTTLFLTMTVLTLLLISGVVDIRGVTIG